jgi:hypothetical protein
MPVRTLEAFNLKFPLPQTITYPTLESSGIHPDLEKDICLQPLQSHALADTKRSPFSSYTFCQLSAPLLGLGEQDPDINDLQLWHDTIL